MSDANEAWIADCEAYKAQEERAEAVQEWRETVEDLVLQFAVHTTQDGVPALWSGGLSALEGAFHMLGWSDPYPYPQGACQADGCGDWGTCGTPTDEGYKWLCGKHYQEVNKR